MKMSFYFFSFFFLRSSLNNTKEKQLIYYLCQIKMVHCLSFIINMKGIFLFIFIYKYIYLLSMFLLTPRCLSCPPFPPAASHDFILIPMWFYYSYLSSFPTLGYTLSSSYFSTCLFFKVWVLFVHFYFCVSLIIHNPHCWFYWYIILHFNLTLRFDENFTQETDSFLCSFCQMQKNNKAEYKLFNLYSYSITKY